MVNCFKLTVTLDGSGSVTYVEYTYSTQYNSTQWEHTQCRRDKWYIIHTKYGISHTCNEEQVEIYRLSVCRTQ